MCTCLSTVGDRAFPVCSHSSVEQSSIGVTSYGALGHVSAHTSAVVFQLFYLSGHFRAAQSLKLVAYPEKNMQVYSFVTVHCMNFFMCATLKFFYLTFTPLLAPNPGDATAVFHRTSLLPLLSPSSAVVLNHISSHFLIPLSDSSLICTVPAQ